MVVIEISRIFSVAARVGSRRITTGSTFEAARLVGGLDHAIELHVDGAAARLAQRLDLDRLEDLRPLGAVKLMTLAGAEATAL